MSASGVTNEKVLEALRRYWGYESLRPVQERAIRLALDGRDSLVVMPTGGGKSLCYQLPALLSGQLVVVVSPLIALMKDQVDGLRLIGYPAEALFSGQDLHEQREITRRLDSGELRLLFLAPERLLTPGILARLAKLNRGAGPAAFAIDEAHCISQWGHDFRPEYRRLAELRQVFPRAALHAFTATATPRVRDDIVTQLGLRRAEVLVGTFDRPNLTYRVVPKVDQHEQIAGIIRRHRSEAVIVYAISRKNTEEIAQSLTRAGIKAEAYHAGLSANERRRVQDAFAQERINVVVATVAFGMGIDRSNVRLILHAAVPKSIENYQQETGRAGRDGLPAECVLLYSGGDVFKWIRVIEQGALETGAAPEWVAHQRMHVEEVQRFATGTACRHRFLSEYFGQPYEPAGQGALGCAACDVCLGELELVPDSTVVAQKIVSCVARLAQAVPDLSFGAAHIVGILRGSGVKSIMERGHDKLSTYGLLRTISAPTLSSFVNQLVDLGLLHRAGAAYPVITLSDSSWELLRNRRTVALVAPREPVAAGGPDQGRPFDAGVFDTLRTLRAELARQKSLPAYLIFTDNALQEMARIRPTRPDTFRLVKGVGEHKARDFGAAFSEAIRAYCADHGLSTDLAPAPGSASPRAPRAARPPGARKARAFELFGRKANVEDVAQELQVAISTAHGYLAEFIEQCRPLSVSAWVDTATYKSIASAAENLGTGRYKVIFDHLGGQASYDQIRIVMTHRAAAPAPGETARA